MTPAEGSVRGRHSRRPPSEPSRSTPVATRTEPAAAPWPGRSSDPRTGIDRQCPRATFRSLRRRRSERTMGAVPLAPCPDVETIQRLVEGGLEEAQRARVISHADACGDCHALLAALIGDRPAPDPDAVSPFAATDAASGGLDDAFGGSWPGRLGGGASQGHHTG